MEIAHFYKEFEADIKLTTVNWRVNTLIQKGVLKRIGRGQFVLGEGKYYVPEISAKMKTIFTKIKKEFPYMNFCIWVTSALNEFMLHQPNRFYILIEVDKDATQSIFYFLREAKYPVFIEPTKDILEKYVFIDKEALIVRPLVTEAPTQNVMGVNTVSIEKMLVDIFCDDVVFASHQGAEMRTIFKEAITKYSINQNRMLRYSDRRNKKESFKKYLSSITNFLQE